MEYKNILHLFQQWLVVTHPFAEPTLESYTSIIKNFLAYALAFHRCSLNDLDQDFLHAFIFMKSDGTPYAPASVKVRIAALGLFFGWAFNSHYARQDLIVMYKKARIRSKPLTGKPGKLTTALTIFSVAEQQALLSLKTDDSFTAIRTRCLITLILATALFIEEVVNLQESALQLDKGYVEISDNNKRARRIDLANTFCKEASDAWLKIRAQTIGAKGKTSLAFFTPDLMPLNRHILYRNITEYLRQAGIEKDKCSPEILRQTAICNMFCNGKTVAEVQLLTGIKTLAQLELYQRAAILNATTAS
jgi:site-specific recombinase XerD